MRYKPRPLCAICDEPIPMRHLSDRDWAAELAYCLDTGEKPRDFYCGMPCFRVARDAYHSAQTARLKAAGKGRYSLSKGRRRVG
jgi:hypothetical protein